MSNKYQIDPTRRRGQPDIVEYVKDLTERVQDSEVGLRIGHTAIEDGDLVVLNGDIKVKESDGTTVLQIVHGATPEIRMFPLGDTSTHMISWFGFDLGTPPDVDQAMLMEVERAADLIIDGGKLYLTRNYAIFGHHNFGGEETYLWFNADPAFAESIVFRGRFRDSWQYDTRQAFYPGTINASSGVSTWTHTYASSFADQVVPIITVTYSGATLQWNIDNFTQSAFTVRFSTTTGSKFISFFNVRVS